MTYAGKEDTFVVTRRFLAVSADERVGDVRISGDTRAST